MRYRARSEMTRGQRGHAKSTRCETSNMAYIVEVCFVSNILELSLTMMVKKSKQKPKTTHKSSAEKFKGGHSSIEK